MEDLLLKKELLEIDKKGLKRNLKLVKGPQGSVINIEGKDVLNFCSNNYLGLAGDNRLREAAINSIKDSGFGSGASRLICGNMQEHHKLEKIIAEFKGVEKCVVFSTGYMANVGIISSIFGRGDLIFSDRLNHASIIDGILLSHVSFKRYKHTDMEDLESMLKDSDPKKRKCIITDSVFSMDGDIAPLDKIVKLAQKYKCMVMVDEAHAFGIMGRRGKGLVEYFGLDGGVDIQMGTLSKAVGSFGAYCCGKSELIEFIINKARSFIYTTGMPPAVAAASIRGIQIMSDDLQIKEKLWRNTYYLIDKLKKLNFNIMKTQTPIIPILVKDSDLAAKLSRRLFEEGIFVNAIRPPTVPANTSRLRITVMATHTRDNLRFLIYKLKQIGEELCLI